MAGQRGRLEELRANAFAVASEVFLRGFSAVARMHPLSRPEAHQVEVLRDLPYRVDRPPASGRPPAFGRMRAALPGRGDALRPAAHHHLDVYRPTVRPGPWPIVFYVHGGGFSLLSKDTHWVMGLSFAHYGYLVVNISYRLAPEHRYPAAIDDTCAAWLWMLANAERLGGDLSRVAVAGESAGGNLVTALTLAACRPRAEPWARAVWDAGVVPRATMPFCALLEVSRPHRFAERQRQLPFVDGLIHDVSAWYLPEDGFAEDDPALELADPLVAIERGGPFERPLPPFFVPVGTRDPLLDDTRRLEKALAALNVPCEARYYPGGVHAFHALVWTASARRCWRDALAFLDRHLRDRRALAADG